ncbi:MAG TPA: SPOR domain-containing protein, partial [Xanthobacteraceae bacterium]|nr:SPOR domain-containing protein [Xanthobacteraceae bacterium]
DSTSYRPSRGGPLPPRRDGPSTDPARQAVSDPLAELARLIGQDEAFGAIVRNSARPEPRREPDPSPASWRGHPGQAGTADRDERPSAHPRYDTADDSAHTYSPEPHAPSSYAHEEPAYAPSPHDAHGYETAHGGEESHEDSGHAQAASAPYGHDAAGEYYGEDGEGHEGHYEGEDDYADALPERKRGGLVLVAAVIGLALVGTAGAFGYWAWSTGPQGEPRLIKADTAPNKIVPATQGADNAGNKRIYDRFAGDQGAGTERMVSREEAPVDVKSAPPRQVYPSAGGVYGPAPGQPAAAPAPPPTGVSANGEPHRVHTETIRPNQVAAVDFGQPVAPPLAAAPASPPSPPSPAPAPAKQAAPRSKQGAAPLVLGAQSPAAQPTDAAPPARSAVPAGGYVVQLSSQRSEEEARASFKALQTKYAEVFGDREPLIRRVALANKGVYYRAQVGPFGTVAEANQFCSNLKIAGGQCIVQKN